MEDLGQFVGHDHTIYVKEYLENFHVIMPRYVV